MSIKTRIKRLFPESLKRSFHIAAFELSALFHGNPQRSLKLVGVTGTSGKSTTCELIYNILKDQGVNVGIISTVGAKTKKRSIATGLHVTTPDPFDIPKYLAALKNDGADCVVLECSSHALEQGRLGTLKFDYAVFTNITSDHLDWHKTWENYARAKARLINALVPSGALILNTQDSRGTGFLTAYAEQKRPDVKIHLYERDHEKQITVTSSGLVFKYKGRSVHMPIIGEYNADNAIAAIKLSEVMGLPLDKSLQSLKTFEGLPGRMQIMTTSPFMVIVDFAHNADSLEKSLQTLRKLLVGSCRLITVFGSAGLRDREKRFTMGQVSGKLSDITIITAEDPRTESLSEINSAIIKGAKSSGGTLVSRFKNTSEYKAFNIDTNLPQKAVFSFDEARAQGRLDAVEFAITLAEPGDIVVTEGKGHEESLCFGTTEYFYTDQDAVEKALYLLAKEQEII